MKLLSKLLLSTIIASSLMLASCSNGGQKTKIDSTESESELNKEQVEEQVREFIYPLPTSFETTEMLNRIGAGYIFDLSNAPINADKYFTEKSKALNLGVFGADLSYASTYNQKQQIIDYMNASKKLVDKLDFSQAFASDLVEQIEENENNKEELVKIISNSFYDTYEYLNKNDRSEVSLLILTGSWVEALYVATHISEETLNNVEMIKIVMDQKSSLDKLLVLLEAKKGNESVNEVLSDLDTIIKVFGSIDGAITIDQMKTISDEIKTVRDKIVS